MLLVSTESLCFALFPNELAKNTLWSVDHHDAMPTAVSESKQRGSIETG
jgi:hypothetical protein